MLAASIRERQPVCATSGLHGRDQTFDPVCAARQPVLSQLLLCAADAHPADAASRAGVRPLVVYRVLGCRPGARGWQVCSTLADLPRSVRCHQLPQSKSPSCSNTQLPLACPTRTTVALRWRTQMRVACHRGWRCHKTQCLRLVMTKLLFLNPVLRCADSSRFCF